MTNERNLIMSFASNEDVATGYEKFVEYYNAFKSNKGSVGVGDNEISMEDAHKKMNAFFSSEIERVARREMKDYKSNLMQYFSFTDVREAAFAVVSILTDLIVPNAILKDVAPIAEFTNVGWGDTAKVLVKPRDIFVPSKIGHGRRMGVIHQQFAGEVTIPTYLREVTVGVPFYDVLLGRYTLAEYMVKAATGLEAQIRYDVWDAFETAVGALDSSGTAKLVYTGYTQDDFVNLAETIGAWNQSRAVVLGTKTACSKVLPASTNYRIDLDASSYVKNGSLRDFMGTEVIQMEQIADYRTEFSVKLDNTKLYFVSPAQQKIIHVAMEGNTLGTVKDNKEAANLIATGTMMKSWGVAAATAALAGVITIS